MSDPAGLLASAAPSLTHPGFVGGRAIGTALRVFRRNAFAFCLVAVAFLAPAIFFDLATGERGDASTFSMMIWNVLDCFVTAAVVRGTLDALEGRAVRLGALFGAAAGSGFRVLGVSIIAGTITVLGLVLAVIPGLIATAGLYLASAVVVAEGISASGSIERSWKLTRGHRWATLGIALLFFAFPIAVNYAAWGLSVLLWQTAGRQAVLIAGNVAVASATALPPAAAAVAYRDLRAEKEGVPASELGSVFE